MGASVSKILLIEGPSGSGKTAAIREVTAPYRTRIGGFMLEPMMSGSQRRGVMMRTFDGQERMLASKTVKSPLKIGNFKVDLNALENVGVPALKLGLMTKDLIVVDEIGVLEEMSERFRLALMECLHGTKPIIATLRGGSHPFGDLVRKLPDIQTLHIAKISTASLKQQVRKWIEAQL